jgi:hypothetical protein
LELGGGAGYEAAQLTAAGGRQGLQALAQLLAPVSGGEARDSGRTGAGRADAGVGRARARRGVASGS